MKTDGLLRQLPDEICHQQDDHPGENAAKDVLGDITLYHGAAVELENYG
ncbi:hypothetical protein GHK47_06000 [Sinorhizobium meliloti]|nr:hypothetical protein [Sinorhizobium meliloti]